MLSSDHSAKPQVAITIASAAPRRRLRGANASVTSPKNAIGPHWRSANAPFERTAIDSRISATATGATATAARGAGPGAAAGPRWAALRGEISSAMVEIPTLSPMRVARHVVGLTALAGRPGALARPRGRAERRSRGGQPSGVIYEIPLDNARLDAAPGRRDRQRRRVRGGTGSGGGSGGGGSGDAQGTAGAGAQSGTVSPIRSENGFGSSSKVPGAGARPVGVQVQRRVAAAPAGRRTAGPGARAPAGSSDSTSAAAAESLGDPRSASITPSRSRAYVLLLLALAVAAGWASPGATWRGGADAVSDRARRPRGRRSP